MKETRRSGTRDVTRRLPIQPSSLILLVQHDPGRLELLHFVLEDAGFLVRTAPNLSKALTEIRAGLRPGLALLDLPDNAGGGAAFASAARAVPGLADLPVIVITSAAEVGDLSGTTSFLLKPFRAAELVEALRAHGLPTRSERDVAGA